MARPLKIRKISPDDPPNDGAKRILRTRIKEFFSHWSNPDRTPTLEQLHDLRIAGKRLRYSAESLRELYPDRLALLIDLLKRGQDQLGDIQDCVTQRDMIEKEMARMRRRNPQNEQIAVLEKISSEYDQRQSLLLAQFHETWRGMRMEEFRNSLKAMVSRARKTRRAQSTNNGQDGENREQTGPVLKMIAGAESFSVDQTGDETRAEAVINVDDGDV